MTIFGWDASDYDWSRGSMNLKAAASDGITFFTHKATEGTGTVHEHYGDALTRARDAGIPFLGAYHVVRSVDVGAQVDHFLNYLNAHTPWWRDFPGWFFQADLELWKYDRVSAATGDQFADLLAQRTGKVAILYASRGQYGDGLGASRDHPLWNADYAGNPTGHYRELYPGDSGRGWNAYSGQTPAIWQFSSKATIGSQPGCDANAFRGTREDFAKLIKASSPEDDAGDFVGSNADGRLQVFCIGDDGALHSIWQTVVNGEWSQWRSFGGQELGSPVVASNADGRLQVFCVGGDGALYSIWQTVVNGEWGQWRSFGGQELGSPVVASNADGRLQVFCVGGDGVLYSIWQTVVNGEWSQWKSLGGQGLSSHLAVGPNADGRLQVFCVGGDGALYSVWQTVVNGEWGQWRSFGGQELGSPVVAANADGRLQVFCVGGDGVLYSIWQTVVDGEWSQWKGFGGQGLGPHLAVGPNADGRLQVFCVGGDGALYSVWQTVVDGEWGQWRSLGGQGLGPHLAVGPNADGRLQVFCVGGDGALYSVWQTVVNGEWSQWRSFQKP